MCSKIHSYMCYVGNKKANNQQRNACINLDMIRLFIDLDLTIIKVDISRAY